ncbi:MAG: sulfate permease [Pseudomonadota bacterium]
MIAILEARRAGLLRREHLLPNIVAGIIVGVVALPLGMAFAIASGARPEQGLYTSIIAGLLTALFGGSRVQISGPTGAFIVILAAIAAQHGIDGLLLASMMAGFLLLAMGLARLGGVIKYIPDPVVVGFTAGIAVIIWVGQWKDFFGLAPAPGGEHFHQKLWHLLQALPQFHPATTALALLALALLVLTPRLIKRVPGPLVALVAVTTLQAVFHFDGVATIGSAFGGIPQALPTLQMPEISFTRLVELIGPAITIAMLGAIESLLSAVVADGMAGTRHDSNQELIGQGIANIVTPLFGGIAATGAIARTATNIRNGGNSPVAAIVHSLTLLLVILVLAPLAVYIPLAALAAILFVVAYNMSEARHFWHMLRHAPRNDVIVLLITFSLTVFADLVVAVNVGVVLAALLFMHRMAQTVRIEGLDADRLAAEFPTAPAALPPDTLVYTIEGPFFFGATETFERTMAGIHARVRTVILCLGRVPFIDATGLQTLEEVIGRFQQRQTRVILCQVNATVLRKLENAGLLDRLGREQVVPQLSQAIAKAAAAD